MRQRHLVRRQIELSDLDFPIAMREMVAPSELEAAGEQTAAELNERENFITNFMEKYGAHDVNLATTAFEFDASVSPAPTEPTSCLPSVPIVSPSSDTEETFPNA